jgi:drug/metabolite transporter (DMT)-like permease
MSTLPDEPNGLAEATPPIESFVYLFSAILLLSTMPTMTKYVFQHSTVDPFGMAIIKVAIGFFFLLAVTLAQDCRGLCALTVGDVFRLTLLGVLGVGSNVIAAWGIQLTSVTHYILIYSLLSPITALFSILLRKSQGSPLKMIGIAISLIGGWMAISEKLAHFQTDFGFGDLLILLFTIMMAVHLVWSANIVKRFGAMTANTVMFGSSAFLLFLGSLVWARPPTDDFSVSIVSSALYLGVATASIFLLRYLALQSISPSTVAVYQNLTPVCAILFAYLYLGEPIQSNTMVGGGIILLGAEVVRRASQPRSTTTYPWARRCFNGLAGLAGNRTSS